MKFCKAYNSIISFCLVILATLFISGCIFGMGSSEPQDNETFPVETVKKPTAVYYDFEDILVPMELAVVKDRTMIVSTPGFKSGILTLKGRVESNSLFNFFSANMDKDNWQVLSRIKSPETIIMVYQKTSRCAVITIRDEQIYTYAEIAVAPTVDGNSMQKSEDLTY